MAKKRDKNTNNSLFHKTILDGWGKIRFRKSSPVESKEEVLIEENISIYENENGEEEVEITVSETYFEPEPEIKKEEIKKTKIQEEPENKNEKIKLISDFSEYYRTKIKRTITLLKLSLIAVVIIFGILILVQWKNISSLPDKISSINNRLTYNDLRFEMQKAINRSTSEEKLRELKKLTVRPEFKPLLAEIYFNMGYFAEYYDDRLDYFHAALEINPNYAEIYNLRGVMRYENKELEGAMEDYEKAISLKKDFAEAYNNRGVVLYEQKKIDEAILDFNKVIKLSPDFAETYYNRGRAFFDKKQYQNALKDYECAYNLNPKEKEYKRMIEEVKNVMNNKSIQTPNTKVKKRQKSSKKEISQLTV